MTDTEDAPREGASARGGRRKLTEEERRERVRASDRRRRERERAGKRGERGPALLVAAAGSVSNKEQKRRAADRMRAWRTANPDRVKDNREIHADKNSARAGTWYRANPERAKESRRAYRETNRDRDIALSKEWRSKNPEKARDGIRAWHRSHPDYDRRRRREDPNYRLICIMRARLSCALKRAGAKKDGKTTALIGCTIAELREHIERQFLPGMSWENHGIVWHCDHIRPICTFDLGARGQQAIAFHYSNLRPLSVEDNLARPRSMWVAEAA